MGRLSSFILRDWPFMMTAAMTPCHFLFAFVLLALTALAGCAAPDERLAIADLREIPQDCRAALGPHFTDRTLIAPDDQARLADECRRTILSPWHVEPQPWMGPGGLASVSLRKNPVLAAFRNWPNDTLGENLLPRSPRWSAALMKEATGGEVFARSAITVRNTSFRQLPTVEPAFLPPGQGVGFPFDRLQESAMWANTPVRVICTSSSGSWVWAESCFSAGWVPANDVAFVDKQFEQTWSMSPLAAIVRDGVSLRSLDGTFIATEHIGAVLPIVGSWGPALEGEGPKGSRTPYPRSLSETLEYLRRVESGEPITAGLELLAAERTPDGTAKAVRVRLPIADARPLPVPATAGRVADLANRMLGQSYGWGGLHELRDCSAMTRDLFAPFGLYLPRNSSEQARAGRIVPLGGMSDDAKERLILRDGVPMLTLLGAPGHVMLYLGRRDGKALIMHNTWGVKVRNPGGLEGYKLIGRCCITTLRPGIELPNVILPDGDLRHAINVMVLLDGGDARGMMQEASPSDDLKTPPTVKGN
jgi:cell wall-associated NlpC family hydrolase